MHFLSHLICISRCFCSNSSSRDYLEPLKDFFSGLSVSVVFPSDNYPFHSNRRTKYVQKLNRNRNMVYGNFPKSLILFKCLNLETYSVCKCIQIHTVWPRELKSFMWHRFNSLRRRTMSSLTSEAAGCHSTYWPFMFTNRHSRNISNFLGYEKIHQIGGSFASAFFSFNFTNFSRSQRCKMRLFLCDFQTLLGSAAQFLFYLGFHGSSVRPSVCICSKKSCWFTLVSILLQKFFLAEAPPARKKVWQQQHRE